MKVIIATQAYNAEDYLAETIESVLNQTYTDYTYLLIDSASTDSTPRIMQEYAKKDSRIKYIHFDVNALGRCEQCAVKEDGDYYMALDSDDLLEPDCLEKFLSVAKESDADIVVSGSKKFDDETKSILNVSRPEQSFLMKKEQFAELYSFYHFFFRQIWGKLYKLDVVKKVAVDTIVESPFFYGKDTWFAFQALRKAENVYFFDNCLHKYRIRNSSVSYTYRPVQSDSDIFLFNDAIDFLSQYGEISQKNMDFIYWVYANAIKDTVRNLVKSNLSADEKLNEYLKIFKRPETRKAFLLDDEKIQVYKCELLFGFLSLATKVKNEFEKVLQVLTVFSPDCVSVINKDNIKLFAENDTFKTILFNDDKNALVNCILTLIEKNDSILKQYNFASMLQKLSSEHSLVKNIENVEFVRLYNSVYRLLWNVQNSEALQKMIEIMLSGNELECPEDFLNVFVTLAALENNVDAFIFGNIQKAYLFIDEKRFDEAKRIVTDLIEMGLSDNEDVIELQKILKN